MLTLTLPADTPLPVIAGQWKRQDDGSIEARYTRYELAWAEACAVSEARLPEIVVELQKLDTEARRAGWLAKDAREARGL